MRVGSQLHTLATLLWRKFYQLSLSRGQCRPQSQFGHFGRREVSFAPARIRPTIHPACILATVLTGILVPISGSVARDAVINV
jgi:hypothetical protein